MLTEQYSSIKDIVAGFKAWELWGHLAWIDIRKRYRRSVIGPFWLTLSLGVLVLTLGLLYGRLLKIPMREFMPHVALGFIGWQLMVEMINEGCSSFIRGAPLISQLSLPKSIHAYRLVWNKLLILGHNFIIYLIVVVVYSINPGWTALLAIPGLLIILLNGFWIALLFGLLSARFRDIPQIITSITRVAFFLTPIIWMPHMLPQRAVFLDFNPFYHFLEIFRAPLLGQVPALEHWLVSLGILAVGSVITLLFYERYRWRIVYWL
jgi:ABC-type polysaccharide/polyol phosphate export permease